MTEIIKIATRDAYGNALVELGKIYNNIVVLDADLSKSTKTNVFAKQFPERFFDIGIAEQNMIGIAAGLATAGKVPFVSSFAIFATGRTFEQIRNTVCYSKINVKIAATHAGLTVGEDGATHQALEDIAIMRAIPNMTVIVPADGIETVQAVKAAYELNGPVYIRLGRSKVPTIFTEDYKFNIGKGTYLRKGNDVTFVGTGLMTAEALKAAEILASEGIEAEVINISTIKPLDEGIIIESASKTRCIVTAEEHSMIGGLGSAVAETLSSHCPVPMTRVGVKDTFGESGKPDQLLIKYGLTANDLVKTAKKLIEKK